MTRGRGGGELGARACSHVFPLPSFIERHPSCRSPSDGAEERPAPRGGVKGGMARRRDLVEERSNQGASAREAQREMQGPAGSVARRTEGVQLHCARALRQHGVRAAAGLVRRRDDGLQSTCGRWWKA